MDMETFFNDEKDLTKKEDNTDNILFQLDDELPVDDYLPFNYENDAHNNFGNEHFSTILPC